MTNPLFDRRSPLFGPSRGAITAASHRGGQPDPHVQGDARPGKGEQRNASHTDAKQSRFPRRRHRGALLLSDRGRHEAAPAPMPTRAGMRVSACASRRTCSSPKGHRRRGRGRRRRRWKPAARRRGAVRRSAHQTPSTANTLTNTCARPSPRKHWGFVRPGGGEPSRTTRPPRVAFGVVRLG
jgi:hypothetical protein